MSCQLYVQCLANSQSKLLTSAQRQSLLYGHKNWHWSNLPWLHFTGDRRGVGMDNWRGFGGMVKCESSLSEWQNQSQLYHLLSSHKMCRSCECFPSPFPIPFLSLPFSISHSVRCQINSAPFSQATVLAAELSLPLSTAFSSLKFMRWFSRGHACQYLYVDVCVCMCVYAHQNRSCHIFCTLSLTIFALHSSSLYDTQFLYPNYKSNWVSVKKMLTWC